MPQLIGQPTTNKFFLCGIILGASYFGYSLMKKYRKKKSFSVVQKQHRQEQHIRTEYSDFYFDKNLQIQILEGVLPQNPTVEDIYLQSPLITKDQYFKYTKQMRKSKQTPNPGRRLIRKVNEEQYIELIITYEQEVDDLLGRSRLQLIEFLNIEQEQFEKMEENYDLIENLHALHKKSKKILQQELIKSSSKKMSHEKLKKIIDEEIMYVKTKMYERMKQKLQLEVCLSQNQILAVIRALQQDIIYEKYGYEWEDIEKAIKDKSINTEQRNNIQCLLQAEVFSFSYQSLENSRLSLYQENEEELKKSIPTIGLSSDIRSNEESIDQS